MRSLLLALLFLLLIAPASAQTVSSLTFSAPRSMDGLYVDDEGILYVTSGFLGSEIYRVAPDGTLSVFASGIAGSIHLTKANDGNFYATNFNSGLISRIAPDGTVSDFARVDDGPSDIVQGPDGRLYVTHYGDPRGNGDGTTVSAITLGGAVTTFASGGLLDAPVGLDFDDDGTLYVANINNGRILSITPDGSQTLFASIPTRDSVTVLTIGHLVWANERLYATNLSGGKVFSYEQDGTRRLITGTGELSRVDGPAATATLVGPNGIAASITGDTLFVSEYIGPTNRLRIIDLRAATTSSEHPSGADAVRLDADPSPFTGQTTFRFTLASASDVSLTVYDTLGRVVGEVAAGQHIAGDHRLDWTPGALGSGVYFARLTAGTAQHVRPVVYRR